MEMCYILIAWHIIINDLQPWTLSMMANLLGAGSTQWWTRRCRLPLWGQSVGCPRGYPPGPSGITRGARLEHQYKQKIRLVAVLEQRHREIVTQRRIQGPIAPYCIIKGAQVWEFWSFGFSVFLYNKASMERRLWDWKKIFKNLSFWPFIKSFFGENFVFEYAEYPKTKIYLWSRTKIVIVLVTFELFESVQNNFSSFFTF